MTDEQALNDIRSVYPGPSVDPAEELELMVEAFENGVSHDRLFAEAGRLERTSEPLDIFLWRFTKSYERRAEWALDDSAP